MTKVLEILKFPHPKLKVAALPIDNIDNDIEKIAEDMINTMYAAKGIGLAATQVGICKRIFVMDTSEEQKQATVFINPIITDKQGEIIYNEGCLSFPDIYAKVKRANEITVTYLDLKNNNCELKAEGLDAICIQHEIDHLDGITFFDHLSRLKQQVIRQKISQRNKAKK